MDFRCKIHLIRNKQSDSFSAAVKFGDALSLAKCNILLGQLSKCQAPYQCAHGRPAQAPILDLDRLSRDLPAAERYGFKAIDVKAAMVMAEGSDDEDVAECFRGIITSQHLK